MFVPIVDKSFQQNSSCKSWQNISCYVALTYAVFDIFGQTLHTAFKLPINKNEIKVFTADVSNSR